jgi:cyclic pyranopterin phosphate synthase
LEFTEIILHYLKTLPSQELLNTLSTQFGIEKLDSKVNSAAQLYRDNNGYTFGVIEPYDDSFCQTCNRIRLSAEGDLIPCLYFEDSKNIKNSMNSDEKLLNVLQEVIQNKPEKNKWSHNISTIENTNDNISSRAFYYTGG